VRIALLENDEIQRDLMCSVLTSMGHDCRAFATGKEFIKEVRRESFDLHVLDWGLPDMSGFEVLKWIRTVEENPVPVLFVSNHCDERDMIRVLDAGADDFIQKPFSIPMLLCRVHALLRRAYPLARKQGRVTFGRFQFNVSLRELDVDGRRLELTLKEFQLAYLLLSKEGRLLSRQYLLDSVWGAGTVVSSRTLDTHISQVRSKLDLKPASGYRLMSVYSMGYRLESMTEPTVALSVALSVEPNVALNVALNVEPGEALVG